MKFVQIHIETENSAFDEHPGGELARILRRLADGFDVGLLKSPQDIKLQDANGNYVGRACLRD